MTTIKSVKLKIHNNHLSIKPVCRNSTIDVSESTGLDTPAAAIIQELQSMNEKSADQICNEFVNTYQLKKEVNKNPDWSFWKIYVDDYLEKYFSSTYPYLTTKSNKMNELIIEIRKAVGHYYLEYCINDLLRVCTNDPSAIYRGLKSKLEELKPEIWPGMLDHKRSG
jgi:hypothetical protein